MGCCTRSYNDRSANTMNELIVNSCNKCGSTKFKVFSTLDFEEQIVAQRKAGSDYREMKADRMELCERCLTPVRRVEVRA